ncbi:MAG TPA: valine--tRNA ligase [Longimicrobiaceae bacterium]|nr:valine--tRNA ligase [Longimicrobiaceae bacterium]
MTWTEHFEHHLREPEIYRRWEESGAFAPTGDAARPPFTISMPPPNATGTLHLGHAVMLAVEDLLIRWRRMSGDDALWVPGTDHAAIATESVVIRKLQGAGIPDPRGTLGRDELVRRIAEFVEQSRATISAQVRGMGSSCDWSRERYTLDPQLNRCVSGVFSSMFRDGLIYRGRRIVNWDPVLQTTVSDDEIEHEDREADFYTLRYGPFMVGTSRPETKLGDTGVAVHPDDPRWNAYIGQELEVRWPNGPTIKVKVVGDAEHVDPETGTGVLGVTPAHSEVDFQIAQKHDLPLIQVIGEDGRMTAAAGPYAGMTVLECREAFVRDLREAGLLEKVEKYQQPVSLCYRSGQPVEPLPKAQWFIDVDKPAVAWRGKSLSLKQVMREVVETGDITIYPAHERRKYFHWIENLRDWCISRQIWWGHRVPVWYSDAGELYTGHRPPRGEGWVQDPDTLDTWFSSALWTWSTLVDPELARDERLPLGELLRRSPDYLRYHPTAVMETGYDILFFWVARMILMTTYVTGEVPFRAVYLHGLVLDEDGEKMSKSRPEKCIDPLDAIRDHGADALRFALIHGTSAGRDVRLGAEKLDAGRRLVTKIWNAAKLVDRLSAGHSAVDPASVRHPLNRWVLAHTAELARQVTARLEAFALGDAAEHVRSAFRGDFCEFYLEAAKADELRALPETAAVARGTFLDFLRLLHPFLPFATEAVWEELGEPGMLITDRWPAGTAAPAAWSGDVAGVEAVRRAVHAVRSLRAEQEIRYEALIRVRVQPLAHPDVFAGMAPALARLVRAEQVRVEPLAEDWAGGGEAGATALDEDFRLMVQLSAADAAKERQRLEDQLERTRGRLAAVHRRLSDAEFVANAPANIVDGARAEHTGLARQEADLEARLSALQAGAMENEPR